MSVRKSRGRQGLAEAADAGWIEVAELGRGIVGRHVPGGLGAAADDAQTLVADALVAEGLLDADGVLGGQRLVVGGPSARAEVDQRRNASAVFGRHGHLSDGDGSWV